MNQKKKRAMSLALASAVLLSQSSIVAAAEQPEPDGGAVRAADSAAGVSDTEKQEEAESYFTFKAHCETPMKVSNTGTSTMALNAEQTYARANAATVNESVLMEITENNNSDMKEGVEYTEDVIITNNTDEDITFYLRPSNDTAYDNFTYKFDKGNSEDDLVTVKAGQKETIKMTFKAEKCGSYTFSFMLWDPTDQSIIYVHDSCQDWIGFTCNKELKVTTDFDIDEKCLVTVYYNYLYNSNMITSAETCYVKDGCIDVGRSLTISNWEKMDGGTFSAVLKSNNTIIVLENIPMNETELFFSNKECVQVDFSGDAVETESIIISNVNGIGNYDTGPKTQTYYLSPAKYEYVVRSVDKQTGISYVSSDTLTISGEQSVKVEYKKFVPNKNIIVDMSDLYIDKTGVEEAIVSFSSVERAPSGNYPLGYAQFDILDDKTIKVDTDEFWDQNSARLAVETNDMAFGTLIYQLKHIDTLNDGDVIKLGNQFTGKKVNCPHTYYSKYVYGQGETFSIDVDINYYEDQYGNNGYFGGDRSDDWLYGKVILTSTENSDVKYNLPFNKGSILGAVDITLPDDIQSGEYDIDIEFNGSIKKTPAVTHKITTSTEGSGTVTQTDSAEAGSAVSLKAEPKAGYEFKGWEVTGIDLTEEQITDPNLTFVMPDNDVTVKAVFEIVVNTTTSAEAPYLIKIDNSADGKISVSVNDKQGEATAAEGDKVKLEATPRAGFAFTKWTVEGVELTDEQLAKSVLEFEMPANDVSVSAEFSAAKYAVKMTTDGHGTAAASPETANAGDTVTLTATPASGYKFSKWTVVKGDVTIADNKFTMPESDVEIKAEFTKVSSSSSSSGGSSSVRRPSSSSSAAETVTVNGKTGGWSDVTSVISAAANGSTITISGSVEIPADVIAAAAAKSIKLEVKVNDTFTWVLDAAKVGAGSKYLSVSDSVINVTNKTIKSTETSKNFRVTESGLGTGAFLRCNAGKDNSGKFANLFRVNGSALEFVGVVKVDAAGNALLPITAAGSYKIVISGETKLVGDLDNSTGLNALDAALMLKKLVNNEVAADETAKFDFNGDGKANALDAAAILKWIVSK